MKTTISFILSAVWYVGGVCPAPAATYYVHPGESIQDAIDGAADGDWIEVSPGIYAEAIDFKGKAIRLASSGGPQVTTIDGTGHNHVVQCVSGEDPNTILEGFTITGGDANGEYPDDHGGGMFNDSSSPTVTGCILSGNWARYGGGMFNRHSSPAVTGCAFSGNSCYSGRLNSPFLFGGRGGGMLNFHSSPTVTGCAFSGNAAGLGGGMNNETSSPTVTDCIFSSNYAFESWGYGYGNVNGYGTGTGGGMYNGHSHPTVTRCTFSGNAADRGGGMGNRSDSSPAVTNCIFSGNSAQEGGGMFNMNLMDLSISGLTMTGCTFSGNSGGGMCNLTCPINLTVTNCIFRGDSPDGIINFSSNLIVTYSDVQGGEGQPWFGTGCIDADPLFIDPNGTDGIIGTLDDNLRLSPDSPCIDAGTDAGVYEDIEGNVRPWDCPWADHNGPQPEFDMGAYEFVNTAPIADAGEDIITFAGMDGLAQVKLDGTGSYDPDGDELEYFWYDANDLIATSAEPNVILPVGEHVIDLIVNDGIFNSESNDVIITVVGPMEAEMMFVPQALNPKSCGRYVMAVLTLPEGVSAGDLDANEPWRLEPGGVEALFVRMICHWRCRRAMVYVVFDRDEVIEAIITAGDIDSLSLDSRLRGNDKNQKCQGGWGRYQPGRYWPPSTEAEIAVYGKLDSGRTVYGEDTIRFIQPRKLELKRK